MVTIVYYNRLSITFVKPSTVCESKNKMSSEETARQVLAQAPTGKGLASASASGSQGRVPPTSSGTTARGSPPRARISLGPRSSAPRGPHASARAVDAAAGIGNRDASFRRVRIGRKDSRPHKTPGKLEKRNKCFTKNALL